MPVGYGDSGELLIVPNGDCLFGISGVKDCDGLMALDIYKADVPLVRTELYETSDPEVKKTIVARFVMDITTASVINRQIAELMIEFARRANAKLDSELKESGNVNG